MIVLNLQCSDAHPFEGWFDSTDDFDRQSKLSMVSCPMCGDTHVLRLPSGPRVKRAATDVVESDQQVGLQMELQAGQQAAAQMMRALSEMAKSSENVAERFPEEARRMHYGEVEPRSIRGQATLVETRELLEEGIAVLPLPFPGKEDVH